MTDFRALCAELVDAIDSGISTNRMHLSPVMLRARAALAQAEPPSLKEEALEALEEIDGYAIDQLSAYVIHKELKQYANTIRRALEQLDD